MRAKKDDRVWQNCYGVTRSAEIRRVTHILRYNNCNYRSSRRSRMYWARKLLLRDAQFALGCDGSIMSRDSARQKKRIKTSARNGWKVTRGARLVNYILFVILVVLGISMDFTCVCMRLCASWFLWKFIRFIKSPLGNIQNCCTCTLSRVRKSSKILVTFLFIWDVRIYVYLASFFQSFI